MNDDFLIDLDPLLPSLPLCLFISLPGGLVRFGLVWFGLVWFSSVRFDLLVWFGLVRFGSVRFGSVRFGLFVCLLVCLLQLAQDHHEYIHNMYGCILSFLHSFCRSESANP